MPAPIMDAGFYLRNPQGKRRKVFAEDGSPRWERIPSSAGRRRDRAMLRSDGHVVNAPLTSHSANLDLEGEQSNYYRKKHAREGWIPTRSCPVVLAMSGQIDPKCLSPELREDLKNGKGCQPSDCSEAEPCHHVVIEREYRQARRAAETEKREQAHESSSDKGLKAQLATQEKLTEALSQIAKMTDNKSEKSSK